MPTINLEFDDTKVSEQDARALSEATRQILLDATGIQDVFVYGNSAQIKIAVAPIELYVRISDHKIQDEKALFETIKTNLHNWKAESGFPHPINLTLIPMHWQFEVDI